MSRPGPRQLVVESPWLFGTHRPAFRAAATGGAQVITAPPTQPAPQPRAQQHRTPQPHPHRQCTEQNDEPERHEQARDSERHIPTAEGGALMVEVPKPQPGRAKVGAKLSRRIPPRRQRHPFPARVPLHSLSSIAAHPPVARHQSHMPPVVMQNNSIRMPPPDSPCSHRRHRHHQRQHSERPKSPTSHPANRNAPAVPSPGTIITHAPPTLGCRPASPEETTDLPLMTNRESLITICATRSSP